MGEKSGVIEMLTKSLVQLYEEPEKPNDAVTYLKSQVGGGQKEKEEIEKLQQENKDLKAKLEELEKGRQELEEKVKSLEGGAAAKADAMETTEPEQPAAFKDDPEEAKPEAVKPAAEPEQPAQAPLEAAPKEAAPAADPEAMETEGAAVAPNKEDSNANEATQ